MMQQVGLFGGSFDPVHFGHLNLAIEIYEKVKLDKLFFCPANVSPHKTEFPPKATAKDRLNMVKIAIEGIYNFAIYDEEIKRNDVSFTIDTIRKMKKDFSGVNINLIIDQDLLENFHMWKEVNEIFENVNIIIGCRSNFSKEDLPLCFKSAKNKKIVTTRQIEISSTFIRSRLEKKLYCGHLIPAKVLYYIKTNGLY